MGLIIPAVLPASRKDLEEKLARITQLPGVSRVQIDIVDGKFASPASWPYNAGSWKLGAGDWKDLLPALERIEYEIDLMCFDADRAAAPWLARGATRLTFHAESAMNLPRLLARARGRYGEFVTLGLAENIGSDLALIEPCLSQIAYVQFMGIAQIGRQGESFDRRALEKVRVFGARHPEVPVQVDGGVTLANAKELITLGVANLVVGSGLLKANDPAKALAAFEALETPFGV